MAIFWLTHVGKIKANDVPFKTPQVNHNDHTILFIPHSSMIKIASFTIWHLHMSTHPARLDSSSPLHLNILKLTLSIGINTTDVSHMYVKKYPLPEVNEVLFQHYSCSVGGNILLVPL
jgi:uncharacterized membrane protein